MKKLTKEMSNMISEELPFLATVDPLGFPKVGPKGSLHVLDEAHLIYFEHTFRHAYKNLVDNGRAAVAVANSDSQKGFRFEGVAHIHENDEVSKKMLPVGIFAHFPRAAVVIIDVKQIFKLDNTVDAGTAID